MSGIYTGLKEDISGNVEDVEKSKKISNKYFLPSDLRGVIHAAFDDPRTPLCR